MSQRDAYVAIADPTRRTILDLLRDRDGLAAGDIAGQFAKASRPGISRHLRVLLDCGVVEVSRRGRGRYYSLRPEPLRAINQGWLARFGDMQTASLSALRARVEDARAGDGSGA
jgi:DNA-binding transcriptional ArsR family regulator